MLTQTILDARDSEGLVDLPGYLVVFSLLPEDLGVLKFPDALTPGTANSERVSL